MNPLFSIVIPVYNVKDYLSECIEAILCQRKDNDGVNDFEVILVDDGSTDGSSKICDEYAEKYCDFVKVIHKQNEGLLLARRTGYKNSNGEYIINCDSDDFVEKTTINDLKTAVLKYKPDVIIYNAWIYEDVNFKHIMAENIFTKDSMREILKQDVLREYFHMYYTKSMWCKAFKRGCLDINKDYSLFGKHGMGEDTLQSLEIYTNAKTFVYLNKPLYNYRVGSGMTSKYIENYYEKSLKVFAEIEKVTANWDLDDVKDGVAAEYCTMVGRAITQSRLGDLSYSKRRKQLVALREDTYFCKYASYFDIIKSKMQRSHRIMFGLLKYRMYLLIHVMLKVKNMALKF